MVVGIPLCEYGACLLPAVETLTRLPDYSGHSLSRPLPLCEAHLALLMAWRGRYQQDPGCRIGTGG